MPGEDSLDRMDLVRAGDGGAHLLAASAALALLRRVGERSLVHEHPDVPVRRDSPQILLEPRLLDVRDPARLRRRPRPHFERVEHDHVDGPVIQGCIRGSVAPLEEARVRGARVRDLVVAHGRDDRSMREQVALLLEPDAPERVLARARHHVPRVQRKLRALRRGGPRHQRVVAVVGAVVAVDEDVEGAFSARLRGAREPGSLLPALDAIEILRRRLQRGEHDPMIGDGRALFHRETIRFARAVPDAAEVRLLRGPRHRHPAGKRLDQPGPHRHRHGRRGRRRSGLEPGQGAQLVAPRQDEQQEPDTGFQRHDATLH